MSRRLTPKLPSAVSVSHLEMAHLEICLAYEQEGWSPRARGLAERYAQMAEEAGMAATAESWRSNLMIRPKKP